MFGNTVRFAFYNIEILNNNNNNYDQASCLNQDWELFDWIFLSWLILSVVLRWKQDPSEQFSEKHNFEWPLWKDLRRENRWTVRHINYNILLSSCTYDKQIFRWPVKLDNFHDPQTGAVRLTPINCLSVCKIISFQYYSHKRDDRNGFGKGTKFDKAIWLQAPQQKTDESFLLILGYLW